MLSGRRGRFCVVGRLLISTNVLTYPRCAAGEPLQLEDEAPVVNDTYAPASSEQPGAEQQPARPDAALRGPSEEPVPAEPVQPEKEDVPMPRWVRTQGSNAVHTCDGYVMAQAVGVSAVAAASADWLLCCGMQWLLVLPPLLRLLFGLLAEVRIRGVMRVV